MSDTPVKIRTATRDHAQLLAEFGAKTFRDTFGADNTEADMEEYLASAFGPAIQAGELGEVGSTFLIASVDDLTVGYARLRFGDAPLCVGGRDRVEIARFYADVPWIGRGVGAALMRASLASATDKGCDVVWLDVWERNFRAMAFYERWGFVVVGNQAFRLGDDIQNDLLMARPVDP